MEYVVEGEDIDPQVLTEPGWLNIRRKIAAAEATAATRTTQAPTAGDQPRKRRQERHKRKPTPPEDPLPDNDIKVILRPQGGLDLTSVNAATLADVLQDQAKLPRHAADQPPVATTNMCTPHLIQLDTSRLTLKDDWHMDEDAYEGLKSYVYKENLRALTRIQLCEPICTARCNNMCRHQYVDIGCGPGNFTKEKLLSISHPDSSRIVALDRSRHSVDYAKANFSHSRIAYDVFDVEYDDFTPILQRYGPSDRIYSFYTFHYIVDLEKAYRNVAGLLKPGGDCAIAALTGGDVIDVWDAVYRMAEWRQMIVKII
ncbi:uncharacterized protein LOC144141696 [Haemaphysalis longicornis]